MCLAADDNEIDPQDATITVFCQVIGGPSQDKRIEVQPHDEIISSVRRKATLFADRILFGGEDAPPGSTWDDMGIDDAARVQITELDDIKHRRYRQVGEYYGQLSNHKRHGLGELKYNDGAVYKGEFQSGYRHGYGKYTWADGREYEGEWKDNQYHGFGKYTWADGQEYEGEWQGDKRHGPGKCMWASGAVYEGEYKDGKSHGSGKYTWDPVGCAEFEFPPGAMYDGQFASDMLHGSGTLTYPDGRVFDAEWEDNKPVCLVEHV